MFFQKKPANVQHYQFRKAVISRIGMMMGDGCTKRNPFGFSELFYHTN